MESNVLETGAAMMQDFRPVKHICAHLNAFHVYSSDVTRFVEANHYCSHLNEGTADQESSMAKKLLTCS